MTKAYVVMLDLCFRENIAIFTVLLCFLKQDFKRGYFITSIVMVALGTAGIKSNVSPFGAQQVEDVGNDMVRTFFNW